MTKLLQGQVNSLVNILTQRLSAEDFISSPEDTSFQSVATAIFTHLSSQFKDRSHCAYPMCCVPPAAKRRGKCLFPGLLLALTPAQWQSNAMGSWAEAGTWSHQNRTGTPHFLLSKLDNRIVPTGSDLPQ